jgi:hypothetical protein
LNQVDDAAGCGDDRLELVRHRLVHGVDDKRVAADRDDGCPSFA